MAGDDTDPTTLNGAEARDEGAALSATQRYAVSTPAGQVVLTADDLAEPPPPARPQRSLPERVGPYRILKEVGRGGMGVVYLARQESLKRDVALKVLTTGAHADPEDLARFRLEAETVASLRHPNIVQVFEVGEDEGSAYLAMEYVAGGTLAARIGDVPQDPGESARIVETVARATHHAHANGVIHRDLKPGNILLSDFGSRNSDSPSGLTTPKPGSQSAIRNPKSEIVKIADFGLAKQIESRQQLTTSGIAVGTPSYMSPEQARGDGPKVGPATDVYALGVILYECLTGRPPFKGNTPIDTMEQVCNHDPVPVRQLQPKVPRDLETIALKCLRKEPEKRYASAEALADDLARFLDGRPIEARRTTIVERLAKWARRNRAQAALACGIVVVGLLGLLGSTAEWVRAEREWDRAEARAAEARTAEDAARRNLTLATVAEGEAREARRRSEQAAAQLAVSQGLALCEQGNVAHGLLWLVRALELVERSGEAKLDRAVRVNLADWSGQYAGTTDVLHCPGGIRTLAFHPKDRLIASADLRGDVRIWDLDRPGQSSLLPNSFGLLMARSPRTDLRHLAWDRDGAKLAAGFSWGLALIWDAKTRKAIGSPLIHNLVADDVWTTAFTPDGKTLLTSCHDGQLRAWDITAGKQTRAPLRHLRANGYLTLALSDDGATLVSGGADGRVCWWEWRAGATTPKREVQVASLVEVLTFAPGGKLLVVGTRDGAVHAWDAAAEKLRDLPPQGGAVIAVAFSADGRLFATGTRGGEVRLWDADSLLPVARLPGADHEVTALSFHADGRLLAVGQGDGAIRVCPVPAVKALGAPLRVGLAQGGVHTVAFDRSGRRLLVAAPANAAVWDWGAARLGPLLVERTRTLSAALSPDGRTVATGAYYGQLVIVDTANGCRTLFEKIAGDVGMSVTRFRPDGKRLLTFSQNDPDGLRSIGLILDVPPRDFVPRRVFANLQTSVRAADWFPDGRRVALGCQDRTVRIWDPDADRQVGPTLTLPSSVAAVAVDAKGERLLTGCRDGTARLWDLATGTPLTEPMRHRGEVGSVAFAPDGALLLTGSLDGTARFWDPESGRPLGPALRHPDGVLSVGFHPDGKVAATGCVDRAARLWHVPVAPRAGTTAELKARAEALTGMTLDESGALTPLRPEEVRRRAAAGKPSDEGSQQ
jgi:WD40 repeat protein/serine/threonine protein kinase